MAGYTHIYVQRKKRTGDPYSISSCLYKLIMGQALSTFASRSTANKYALVCFTLFVVRELAKKGGGHGEGKIKDEDDNNEKKSGSSKGGSTERSLR